MLVQNHPDSSEPEDFDYQHELDIEVTGATTPPEQAVTADSDQSIDGLNNLVDPADQLYDQKLQVLADQFVPEVSDLQAIIQRRLNNLKRLADSEPTPALVERYIGELTMMVEQVSSGLYPIRVVLDAVKTIDALMPQLFSRGLSAALLDAINKLPSRLNERYSLTDQVDVWTLVLQHLSYAALTSRINAVVNILEDLRKTATNEQEFLHGATIQLYSLLDTEKTLAEVEHIRLRLGSYARACGDDRLLLQLELGLAWHHAGHYRAVLSRDHAMNAYALAATLADKRAMVKAALYLSNALTLLQNSADHPDYQQVDQYLDQAEMIAKETDDIMSLRYITLNRCNLLYNRGDFKACIKLALHVKGLFVEVVGMQSRLKYLLGMSYRDIDSDHSTQSLLLLEQARAEFVAQGAMDDVLNCEFAIAKWKAKFSRLAAAQLHMKKVVLPLLNERDPEGLDSRRHEFKL